MKRLAAFLATICALSLFGWLARAQSLTARVWQDFENTGGFTAPVTSSCFLYASAAFDIQCYTPSTGLTLGASALTVDLSTGKAGGQAAIGGTGATDSLTLKANNNASPSSGARIYFQTPFGNDYFDPIVGTLGLGNGGSPISMFKTGAQFIAKSSGDLELGTVDAHNVDLITNGLTAVELDSSQHVVIPILGGAGNQCLEADNTGQVFGTGAVCGSGGGGGVSSIAGNDGLTCSPTTGAATCSGVGVYVSGTATASSVDMGALTSGVNEQTTSLGVATPVTFATTPGEVQFGAASGGGLANDAGLFWDNTSKRLGIGTNSPVISFQDQANVNGDLMGAVVNTSTGTGARSLFAFGSTSFASPSLTLLTDGVNFVGPGGLYTAGSAIWYYNSPAAANLVFQLQAGGFLVTTGGSPVGGVTKLAVTNAGHVQVADLAAGGMTKSTASAGQLAVAVAGTDYQPPTTLTCTGSNWAKTVTTAGSGTCTQPTFSDIASTVALTQLPTIAAHTLLANGTGLAAQAAQTNIGTTLAFDGTSQLQCVGLRDGGGVNHVTTGTWPILSVLGTDVSGNVAAETALTCGQSEGPWTGIVSKAAGSCATGWQSIWPTSGDALLSAGPTSTPTGVALTANTVLGSAGAGATALSVQGGIGTFIGNVLSGVNFGASGAGHSIGMVPDPGSTAGATRFLREDTQWVMPFTVSMSYSAQIFTLLNTGELVQGGISPNPVGSIGTVKTEYPIGVAAGTVTLACVLNASHVTGGTFTFKVARNGVDTGVSQSFTSGSSLTPTPTSGTVASPATSDRWGLDASSVGTANNCGSGICPADLTCSILLTP